MTEITMENSLYFCLPSRVVLEPGARHRVAPLCKQQKWRVALIVTDRFFSQQTTVITELCQSLKAKGIDALVFDGGIADPTTVLCDEATRVVLSQALGSKVDHVIAVGGGSNIDLAKALCLTIPFQKPIAEFVGTTEWPGKPLPMLALPTTAGTGSEITPGAILVEPSNATKVAVMGNDLRPHIAVIDPELTLSCPPKVTADAGLDALTHAIESWLTKDSAVFDVGMDPDPGYSGRNRVTMLFAKESVKLCFENLQACYLTPHNIQARTGMAYASLLAAFSYGSAGLNAVHGLAYALAGITHQSHGSTNAVLLPYVMDALVDVRTQELAAVARLAGLHADSEVALAKLSAVHVKKLVKLLGIPDNLKDFGVQESDLPILIDNGLNVLRLTKAFPVQSAEQVYREIVHNAYIGKISGE